MKETKSKQREDKTETFFFNAHPVTLRPTGQRTALLAPLGAKACVCKATVSRLGPTPRRVLLSATHAAPGPALPEPQ